VSYELTIGAQAERELRKLPTDAQARIAAAILALQEQPRPSGSGKLSGEFAGSWKLRVGQYRVLYLIDDTQERVTIFKVGPRASVYKTR
jgi:mRNA interferase RelE/StbE